jgi:molybdopterin synthase catalytic subunit
MTTREWGGVLAITGDPFDVGFHIDAIKRRTTGAVVTFVGVVRDDGIESIEVEAYEEVALGDLHDIREEAARLFDLQEVTILHRTGSLRVGEDILLIAVAAGHRKEAFAGCEYILERIKERAPIWKREILEDGHRWVRGNME